LNRQLTGGKNPVHLAVDPSNRFVVVSNHLTGTLAVLPINADGTLAPLTDLVEVHGRIGPHRSHQPGPRPHHNPFDRAGRFLAVPDKGLDEIFVFRLDANTGKLIANDPPSVRTRCGAGPRHIDFHPNGSCAYVINELDSTITAYRYDSRHGRLTPIQVVPSIPDSFVSDNFGAEIFIAPSGTFLYASNRGHDSIAVFGIEPETGRLCPVGWEPTQGATPRYFGIDPSGTFLYAANEDTDSIVGFRINEATGMLKPIGHPVQTASPVCVVFSRGDD
jgi:6-phosphogluconolactonase (cycloisomerase 2 family)